MTPRTVIADRVNGEVISSRKQQIKYINTECPTRYRNRYFFNNSNTKYSLLLAGYKPALHVTVLNIVDNCNSVVLEPGISLITLTPMITKLLPGYKPALHVTVLNTVNNCNSVVLYKVSHSLPNPKFL